MTKPAVHTFLKNTPFPFFYAIIQWQQIHNSKKQSYVHISATYSEGNENAYDLGLTEYFDDDFHRWSVPQIYQETGSKIDWKIDTKID